MALPEAVLTLGLVDGVDYCDSYACPRRVTDPPARIRDGRSADQVTALAFGTLPTWLRQIIAGVHRHVLRLDLERPSTVPVPGWRRVHSGPDQAVYAVDGSLLAARLVVSVTPATVQVSTLVHYERPVARIVWAGVGPIHRIITRLVLDRGVIAEGRRDADFRDS
ncbi:DUF2867 domain-containing protein [Pseudonocardia petroleophila]|uniref:DUF2867 domain-containing protein n=1 Tax=Pseudonocardia petroleophila TaxID=37331 RepID=A0A7G7MH17_9PSEU|nr:DUF2867 domain-containing protein [Pseudonocardia petroleophila]QNG52078.1 DUF2867 domain-containing protein [Pseudonocardia petroleophila]